MDAKFKAPGFRYFYPAEGRRAGWDLSLSVTGHGRPSHPQAAAFKGIRAGAGYVELGRADGLTEWYRNSAEGLEQGFTLTQPPPGSGEIRVAMKTRGSLKPGTPPREAAPNTLHFNDRATGQPVLVCSGLKAWDSAGQPVAARMECDGDAVFLVVNDASAVYPLTIDPLFTEAATIDGPDGQPARFDGFGAVVAMDGDNLVIWNSVDYVIVYSRGTGNSGEEVWIAKEYLPALTRPAMAIDNDTIVLGMPDANSRIGEVRVYATDNQTDWTLRATLTDEDGLPGDAFGASVDVNGTFIAVGQPGDDRGTAANAGSAFVFAASGAAWTRQTKLMDATPHPEGEFGGAVAVDGEFVVVGTPGRSAGAGGAFLYRRSAGAWSLETPLTSHPAGSRAGAMVALDGGTLLMRGADGVASAYVHNGSAWQFQAALTLPAESYLQHLALSGEEALQIGYRGSGGSVIQNSYLYHRHGTDWSAPQVIPAFVNGSGYGAGALSGNRLALGDTGMPTPAGRGSVATFIRTQTEWVAATSLPQEQAAVAANFGTNVALSGNTALIAVPGDLSAQVFVRGAAGWERQAILASAVPGSPVGQVFLDGDTALVALPGEYQVESGRFRTGRAEWFTRSGMAWTRSGTISGQTETFPSSADIDGPLMVVSEYNARGNMAGNPTRILNTWVRTAGVWTAAATMYGVADSFSGAVAMAGETMMAATSDSSRGAGARVFKWSGLSWVETQTLTGPPQASYATRVAMDRARAIVGENGIFFSFRSGSRIRHGNPRDLYRRCSRCPSRKAAWFRGTSPFSGRRPIPVPPTKQGAKSGCSPAPETDG